MRGGFLPPALLCLALALALAFVPRRTALASAALAAVMALAVWLMPLPPTLVEPVFVGLWVSVIVTAGLVYWPGNMPSKLPFFAAANAGLWIGAACAVAASGSILALTLPLILLAIMARFLIERGWTIALKIGASWLIAVATLAAMVSLTPTPGYAPDHMD